MIKPECFASQAEFDQYMELLEQTVQDADRSYCWDCTHAYRDQMTEEGRCSHPRVYFVVLDDSIVGKRPKKNAQPIQAIRSECRGSAVRGLDPASD